MKQVIVTAPHEFKVVETPIPEPERGEVLIQMKSAGVCGSDFGLYLGKNPNAIYPRVPGHENAGVIAKVGEGVTNVKEGDHVIVDLVIACGECPQCKSGRRNICKTVKARGAAADGGWREYFVASENEVYKISKDIPFKDAALVEPFAIGGHCTKRGKVTGDDLVLVLGSGTIGAVIIQYCKNLGCEVIAADINESTLERAKSYGADYIINTKNDDLIAKVSEITDGAGVDIAFDSACYPGSLTLLMQPGILTNGARVVPLGFATDYEEISQSMINVRELEIIGSRMSTGQFEPTIEKFENNEFTLDGIASHYINFSEIQQVFENMENSPKDMKKMVIIFD